MIYVPMNKYETNDTIITTNKIYNGQSYFYFILSLFLLYLILYIIVISYKIN